MTPFYKKIILLFIVLLTARLAISQPIHKPGTHGSGDDKSKRLNFSRKAFWDSLPKPVGYVNDWEHLYTEEEQKLLDDFIADFQKETTIQIAIITLNPTMVSQDNFDALTLRISNAWGVGQKKKNNGITIAISKTYRRMKIQNGYGIERMLTNRETKDIIDTYFTPLFRDGNILKELSTGYKF